MSAALAWPMPDGRSVAAWCDCGLWHFHGRASREETALDFGYRVPHCLRPVRESYLLLNMGRPDEQTLSAIRRRRPPPPVSEERQWACLARAVDVLHSKVRALAEEWEVAA